MTVARQYYEALMLCDKLERRGMINLVMPEANLLISDRLQGSARLRAEEAIGTYVRAYKLLQQLTLLAAVSTVTYALKVALSIAL